MRIYLFFIVAALVCCSKNINEIKINHNNRYSDCVLELTDALEHTRNLTRSLPGYVEKRDEARMVDYIKYISDLCTDPIIDVPDGYVVISGSVEEHRMLAHKQLVYWQDWLINHKP